MHVISGELRNLKRRAKTLYHFLVIGMVHRNNDLNRATRSANEWLSDELVEPEPVWLQASKDGAQVITTISMRSLNSLNEKHAPERFAGFNEFGRPIFERRRQ